MNKYQEALTLLFCTSQSLPEQKVYESKKVLQELVDKETPAIIIEIDSDDPCYLGIDCYCPKCRETVYEEDNVYCHKCGQKLNWGGTDNE